MLFRGSIFNIRSEFYKDRIVSLSVDINTFIVKNLKRVGLFESRKILQIDQVVKDLMTEQKS